MQLKAAPVEIEIEVFEQPDQAGSLSDVAERSDEVGVKAKDHGECDAREGPCDIADSG
jgi:hypothetical protein